MMLIKAESLEKGRTLVKSFHQPHRKKTRSSGTIKLILFFNLYSSPEEQGWKIRNPSGCYPADIHQMRSADLIRFWPKSVRNIKRRPITVKFTWGPRNFLQILLCMFYGKLKVEYRVFIKYCVYSLNLCDFSELCQFCCSACVLPAWWMYTHWHRGKTEKTESGIF